ncbi:hypothetical protein DRO49_03800 [Candidatus Bathyarchaeota archaeon]|nr:MAG: hypothetical protein DRO49_03800 [Candidatus Bathyarchaeota archaeon]
MFVPKVAALCALGDGRMRIEVKDLEAGIWLLDTAERKIRLAYVAGGRNKLAYATNRIMSITLAQGGKVKLSDLVALLYHEVNAKEMKQVLSTLEQMKVAERVLEGRETYLVVNPAKARKIVEGGLRL